MQGFHDLTMLRDLHDLACHQLNRPLERLQSKRIVCHRRAGAGPLRFFDRVLLGLTLH